MVLLQALRKLVKEGRLEITTGVWVETDEATSHLFGIVHQLMEGKRICSKVTVIIVA